MSIIARSVKKNIIYHFIEQLLLQDRWKPTQLPAKKSASLAVLATHTTGRAVVTTSFSLQLSYTHLTTRIAEFC